MIPLKESAGAQILPFCVYSKGTIDSHNVSQSLFLFVLFLVHSRAVFLYRLFWILLLLFFFHFTLSVSLYCRLRYASSVLRVEMLPCEAADCPIACVKCNVANGYAYTICVWYACFCIYTAFVCVCVAIQWTVFLVPMLFCLYLRFTSWKLLEIICISMRKIDDSKYGKKQKWNKIK